jgi:hypothetical protein
MVAPSVTIYNYDYEERRMTTSKAAITRARNEVAEESQKKAVEQLKVKLRALASAETVVANIGREIAELELAIEQGNI